MSRYFSGSDKALTNAKSTQDLGINVRDNIRGPTPNAEKRFARLGGGSGPKKTSDFGRGGRRGRKITRASSLISSSRSLESLETESCRWTLSCSPTPDHSKTRKIFSGLYTHDICIYKMKICNIPILTSNFLSSKQFK